MSSLVTSSGGPAYGLQVTISCSRETSNLTVLRLQICKWFTFSDYFDCTSPRWESVFLCSMLLALLSIHVNHAQKSFLLSFNCWEIQSIGIIRNRNIRLIKEFQRDFQRTVQYLKDLEIIDWIDRARARIVMRRSLCLWRSRPSHTYIRKNWKFLHFHFKTFDTFFRCRVSRRERTSSLYHHSSHCSWWMFPGWCSLPCSSSDRGTGLETLCWAAVAVVLAAWSLELD